MGFRRSADINRDDGFRLGPVMGHPKAGEKIPKLPAVAGGADCEHYKSAHMCTNIFDVQ